ncbi:hypothetical protein [Halomonas caseinilytica]|uniref:Uncharacterized protein n=1 Tax=Halomonas caseinilytica TaxID=438744 RepID=A0A1M6VGV4_9GAMM|nr:hypothetical protein [Halomonas caseinilytica]SHK80698.1 hypothetical protein SAMN05192556_105194 [Halomonas caseinilytica]
MVRELYHEAVALSSLEQVGIILNHDVGYSSACLVDSNGLVEIKTKLPKPQIELLLADELP